MRALQFLALVPVSIALVLACSDSTGLPDPSLTNVTDTVTLYALEGTPVTTPSAYSVPDNRAVRLDQTSAFDFAYNTHTLPDGTRRQLFLPLQTLGLAPGISAAPGLQRRSETFDAITTARSNGYITSDTIPFAVGDRFEIRSRIVSPCTSLGVPQYGKLEVLGVDSTARTVTFQVLTDNNCGYRGLLPGLPPS
ncbi:MAG: hypothetical protein H0W67_00390 [Gemmatimonadales bacterium]|nr:hypothetical protein [Gemmatimonadales bacterium]